jgi:hypothetical protein
MATITYRKLDPNGDPLWGNGQASFISDLQAVAQAILTRLRLFQGEWWEDLTIGTPMFQDILGQKSAPTAVSLILQKVILGTPYVTGISNLSASWNSTSRAFAFSCLVQTQFGTLTVSNISGNNASLN